MGLPMYRDPDEATVEENVAKVERLAAAGRSRIRRSIPAVATRTSPQLLLELNRRSQPPRSPFVDANDEIQHLEAELERLRRDRILTRARRAADARLTTLAPGDISLYSDHHTGADANRITRESALRFELGPRGPRSGATSPRRHRISRDNLSNRRALPSPPHSIESAGRVRSPPGRQVTVPDGPEDVSEGLTPHFAPASGPFREGPPAPSEGMTRVITEHFEEERNADGAIGTPVDTPPAGFWGTSYPPLRRVGHLSPRPRLSYDVEGDLRRSPSPASPLSAESVVNEDHWETLLTTIDDADLTPSNQSSFDSTTSNSEPGSNQSSQTVATSFGEIGSADDTCDLDLPQGITEENVREIRERHRGTRSQIRPTISADQQNRERRHDETTASDTMAMFQSLLTRLSRREDIPERWWAAAGLSRTVRENV